eukprot:TRINITY_DN23045_c0_g1_i1.p1 TRINITY_DN23045_c0_g1~~TRINITY_DN23045_c0_g1_i1.p1  ORF type:complete len:822 (+),score=241.96 TRINITY_DN23045_c0_g1_i1:49-2466(+)
MASGGKAVGAAGYHSPLLTWTHKFWTSKALPITQAEDGSVMSVALAVPGPFFMGYETAGVMRVVGLSFFGLGFMGAVECLPWAFGNLEVGPALGVLFFIPLVALAALTTTSFEGVSDQVDEIASQNALYDSEEKRCKAQLAELQGVAAQLASIAGDAQTSVAEINEVLDGIDRDVKLKTLTTVLDNFSDEDDLKDKRLSGGELDYFFDGCRAVMEKQCTKHKLDDFIEAAVRTNYVLTLRFMMLWVTAACTRRDSHHKCIAICMLLRFGMEPVKKKIGDPNWLERVVAYIGPSLEKDKTYGKGKLKKELQALQPKGGAAAAQGAGLAEPLLQGGDPTSDGDSGMVPCPSLFPIALAVVNVAKWVVPDIPATGSSASQGAGTAAPAAPPAPAPSAADEPERLPEQPAAPPVTYGAPPPAAPMTYGAPAPPMTYGAPPPMTYGAPAPNRLGAAARPPPDILGLALGRQAASAAAAPAAPMVYGAPPPPMTYGAPAPPMTYGAPPPPVTYGAPPPPTALPAPVTMAAGVKKLGRGKVKKSGSAFQHLKEVVLDFVQRVQEVVVRVLRPVLDKCGGFLKSYDLYLYPIYVIPAFALGFEGIMLIWLFIPKFTTALLLWSLYLMFGTFAGAAFMHANPDILVTYFKLNFQLAGFWANNVTFRKNLNAQEEHIRSLRVAGDALQELNTRFGGNLQSAQSMLASMDADGKDEITRVSSKFSRMYSDKDGNDLISAGAELDDALATMKTIYAGVFRDFAARSEGIKAGLRKNPAFLEKNGVTTNAFGTIIETALLASSPESVAAAVAQLPLDS